MKLLLEFKKRAEKQEKARLEQLRIDGIKKLLMIMFQNGKLLLMLCPLVVLMK
jgi:hypothetical protein